MLTATIIFLFYLCSLLIATYWVQEEMKVISAKSDELYLEEDKNPTERCILAPFKYGTSICGRNITDEVHFISADQWLRNRTVDGGVTACRHCAVQIKEWVDYEKLINQAQPDETEKETPTA